MCSLHVAARRALGSNRRHVGPTSQITRGPLAMQASARQPDHLRCRLAQCDTGNESDRGSPDHCGRSPSPTAAPAPTAPRTRSPPSGVALEPGARGLETDARLTADGEVVLVHDAVARAGWRRERVAQSDAPPSWRSSTSPGSPTSTPCSAPTTSSRSTCTTRPRAACSSTWPGPRARLDRLWVCSSKTALLEKLGARAPEAQLVHSIRRRRVDIPLERHAAHLAEAGIGVVQHAPHRLDRGPGRAVPPLRRARVRLGRRRRCVTSASVLAMDIDAVYSDHVDRMVATVGEWSE